MVLITLVFFFNRHCNPCGFWPAQLSLTILSRKVLTECRCKRHVKPPNLEDQWLESSNSRHQVSFHVWNDASEPQQRKVELRARHCREFCRKWRLATSLLGSFTCRKFTTWDRQLYFPSEGRRAEDSFRPKNPTASAGFEPANSGTRGQHAYL